MLNKPKKLLVFVAFICLAGSAHAGRSITPAKRRAEMLQNAAQYAADKGAFQDFSKVKLPFVFVSNDAGAGAESAPIEDVTDEDVLQYASRSKRPSGLVRRKGEYYLIYSFGVRKAGDSIDVLLGGMTHQVKIESISQKSYTLRFNDAVTTVKIGGPSSKGTITKDS